jgi:hypothetical protein
MMHGHEKSDPVVVAMKPTNKAERSAAEPVEPRTGTKGNVHQRCPCRAQYRVSGPLVAGAHTAGLPWIPEVGAVWQQDRERRSEAAEREKPQPDRRDFPNHEGRQLAADPVPDWRHHRLTSAGSATPSMSRKHLPAAVLVSMGCSVA